METIIYLTKEEERALDMLTYSETAEKLAHRTGTTKSYISRIENGAISPSVGVFYRLIAALGMRIEIVKSIA